MISYDTPLNGEEIATELGITRQAVSYNLRRGMKKMYNYVLDKKWADSPFEAITVLMRMLNLNTSDMDDIKSFLSLFDKNIIEEVKKDAINFM